MRNGGVFRRHLKPSKRKEGAIRNGSGVTPESESEKQT